MLVQAVQPGPQGVQEFGVGLQVGCRAGGAGEQVRDLLGRQPGFEQPADLGDGQYGVVAVLAVAVAAARGFEQALGLVVTQLMRVDSGLPAQLPDQRALSPLTFISV